MLRLASNQKLCSLLVMAVPFFLWLFLMRDFISGAIPFNMDTNTIYGVTKFYFNNLLNGVIPLWDPFVSLGRPFYALSICNLFNPVTQLVPLLKLVGVSYNTAFAIYICVYFWIGCLGFYGLLKLWLKDKHLAYLGYVALLFSSLGVSVFTQLTFVEIVVPTILFFYFLLAYAKKQNLGHFLGVTYALMLAVSSYLPFYFLTVVGIFFLGAVVLWPKESWHFAWSSFLFKVKNWPWVLLAVIGVIIASGPLLAYKLLDSSGDAVSPGRHCQYSSMEECYNRTIAHQGGMLYEEITRSGSLGERLDLGYLLTHWDKWTYGSDSLFFVPCFMYVLVFLSLITAINRKVVLVVWMMLAIGLVGLGSAGPVHRFLFDHVFFFKYFRNLFFFGSFLIPAGIVVAVLGLQALLAFKPGSMTARKAIVVGMLILHGVAAFLLSRLSGVHPSMYVTVALSAGAFVVYYIVGWQWPKVIWSAVWTGIIVFSPIGLITSYSKNAVEFACPLPQAHVKPQFSWVRPDEKATSACRIYQFVPYEDFWYAMSMQDAPAVVGFPQAAAKWVFMLSKQLGDEALAKYAKYKVYLYDDFVSSGQVITGPSKLVDAVHFDVNTAVFRVDLPKEKLFVYNDAYTQHWKVKVDGQPKELLRSSGAFKGVWVPSGEHTVRFEYHPPGGTWVYILTLVALVFYAGLTGVLLWLRK